MQPVLLKALFNFGRIQQDFHQRILESATSSCEPKLEKRLQKIKNNRETVL